MTNLCFDIYLRAAPEQVRGVLTDPDLVPRWLAGVQFHADGAQVHGDGAEDPQRLACEWLQADHLGANGGRASLVQFELAAMGQVTRLKVTHRDLVPGGSFLKAVAPGWPMILSSLKSLVETGRPLEFRRTA
jgi:uncharacterized protein YndB with AHSA1/START domain